ncbi:hypothetical protein [Candidatus Burkholderia verschuerenii]|uniref:hypothetical protein n=1 Tax=Candidatus Burkholderia verschuerenii TaxID=242163 RepID=UPI000B18108E|nr:hypothetical protein [Candidatus Burkholderia verschuerenii]
MNFEIVETVYRIGLGVFEQKACEFNDRAHERGVRCVPMGGFVCSFGFARVSAIDCADARKRSRVA